MPRVNFRTIRDRFTHIDATLVAADVRFPGGESALRVRFYPWWEHPDYVAAVEKGLPWGFTDDVAQGEIEVTVHPTNLLECKLSRATNVTDWYFFEEHPLLWPFEDSAVVYCNEELDESTCALVRASIGERFGGYATSWPLTLKAGVSSFALGSIPATLFLFLTRLLDEHRVRWFCARHPVPRKLPALLLLDGEDYLIADDFDLDVPDVVHKPEWFSPR